MSDRISIGRSGIELAFIRVMTLLLLILVLLPIAVVVLMSFTSATTLQFPPPGFNLRWYNETWNMYWGTDSEFVRLREALNVSLIIATLASAICVVVGVPASYALVRLNFVGRAIIEELIGLPVIFPAVVLGVALLALVSSLGTDLGLFQIVIAHAIVGLPFMVRNCVAALQGIDPALEDAAKTLGASSRRSFIEIVIPLMSGGIASGTLLVFILSFNEFTLSYFLYTVDVFPLSIWLFQQSNTSFSPVIFAISALMVLLNIAMILIVDWVIGSWGNVA